MRLDLIIRALRPGAVFERDWLIIDGQLHWYSQTISQPSEEEISEASSQPDPIPLADRLAAIFDSQLTDVQQAQFYLLRTAVAKALSDGKPDVAKIMIQDEQVVPELEAVMTQVLAEFD